MTGIRENTLLYRLQIGFPTELLCIPPDTTSKIRWMAPFFEGKAIWLDKEKERCGVVSLSYSRRTHQDVIE